MNARHREIFVGRDGFLGITVMPEYFQTEGVEPVLDNLARAGAAAVATSPYVMAPSETGGSREPPADAGAGEVRFLDRPLWSRRALEVTTAPSFAPEPALYHGLKYQPAAPGPLTEQEGRVVGEAIGAAKARGFVVHLQVQAAIPPGYRVQFGGPLDEDRPRLPDGSHPAITVDNNGSLASPGIRAYTAALLRDLIRAYPEIDALRLDWPEYPPYTLDACFLDFSAPAKAAASRLGFAFEAMRRDAGAARAHLLGRLAGDDLDRVLDHGPAEAARAWLARYPGLAELARFKAALVKETIAELSDVVRDASAGRIALIPQGFPPPWNAVSGFDISAIAPLVPAIGVKLYTMHWPMMLRLYGDAIAAANPALTKGSRLAPALAALLDIADGDEAHRDLAGWRYPETDQPHGVSASAQRRKIEASISRAGATPVFAFAHAYGPIDDVRDRIATAFAASGGRVWINRYGYMSDAKLDAVRRVTAAAPETAAR